MGYVDVGESLTKANILHLPIVHYEFQCGANTEKYGQKSIGTQQSLAGHLIYQSCYCVFCVVHFIDANSLARYAK